MKKLHEQYGEPLLGFALELPTKQANFPGHVMQLMVKYFACDKLLFFPYLALDGHGFSSRREALNNFTALNTSLNGLRDYARIFYKMDPFSHKNLPEHLRKRRVVFIEDTMPLEIYEKSSYYLDCYAQHDFYYQACIFLKFGGKNVASLNTFRSKEEGAFTEDERALFTYLSELLSLHYYTVFHSSLNSITRSLFELYYKNLGMGVIMLNQQLIVLEANNAATEYCKLLREENGRADSALQHNILSLDGENFFVQQVVNGLGLELAGDGGTFIKEHLRDAFIFAHNSFLFSNIYGHVETRHLIFINRTTRTAATDVAPRHEKLSQSESRVLECVAKGYNNKRISSTLNVSIYTVRAHLSNIYRKFEVNNKVDLLFKIGQR